MQVHDIDCKKTLIIGNQALIDESLSRSGDEGRQAVGVTIAGLQITHQN